MFVVCAFAAVVAPAQPAQVREEAVVRRSPDGEAIGRLTLGAELEIRSRVTTETGSWCRVSGVVSGSVPCQALLIRRVALVAVVDPAAVSSAMPSAMPAAVPSTARRRTKQAVPANTVPANTVAANTAGANAGPANAGPANAVPSKALAANAGPANAVPSKALAAKAAAAKGATAPAPATLARPDLGLIEAPTAAQIKRAFPGHGEARALQDMAPRSSVVQEYKFADSEDLAVALWVRPLGETAAGGDAQLAQKLTSLPDRVRTRRLPDGRSLRWGTQNGEFLVTGESPDREWEWTLVYTTPEDPQDVTSYVLAGAIAMDRILFGKTR